MSLRAGPREPGQGDWDLVDGLPDDLLRLLVHLDEGEGVVVDEPGEEAAGALLAPTDSLLVRRVKRSSQRRGSIPQPVFRGDNHGVPAPAYCA